MFLASSAYGVSASSYFLYSKLFGVLLRLQGFGGLLFQVVDDILDASADTATLGKTAGKDQAHDKPTYVSLLGLDASRALAVSLRRRAHAALEPFGIGGERLRQLADFVVDRVN